MNDPINHPAGTGHMPQGDFNAPWSLRFERDGTEDVAVLSEAATARNCSEAATSGYQRPASRRPGRLPPCD